MIKASQKILSTIVLLALFVTNSNGQVNPAIKNIPFFEDFGMTTFSIMPNGFGSGYVNGAPVSSQTAAQSSIISAAATLAPTNAPQTNGGSYGYANNADAKFYVQHSASTTTGTNQLIMSINTLNWNTVLVSYSVEMINASSRTAGLILQYRIGTTGSWTNIAGSVYSHSSADRANGAIDNFNNLVLPTAAANQPIVQLRWASWRGTQTGNSSGIAIDNVGVSATLNNTSTNVSASSTGSCGELFLSEYLQDNLGNNAIEIYNPTTASKSLSGYYLTISTGTNTASYIPLSGTIQAGKTFVGVYTKASAALRAKADQLLDQLLFTGNQVVSLVYSTNPLTTVQIIDVIGQRGTAPVNGFTVTALGDTGTTQSHTLTRLMNIPKGNVEWITAQHQWYSHPVGTYQYLGWHNSVCVTSSMPVANMIIAPPLQTTIEAEKQNSYVPNYHYYNFYVSLTGTWTNQISVYYNDYFYYQNYTTNSVNPLNCNVPSASYNDWSYDPNNFVVFNPGSNATGTFTVNIIPTQTESDIIQYGSVQPNPHYIWGCFAIDINTTIGTGFQQYNIGSNYQGNLYISDTTLTTGIENLISKNQLKLYPNPYIDNTTIENLSQTLITKVVVTDVLGRDVLMIKPEQTTKKISIDTHNFDKGVYFIKIYSNEDNFSLKTIKE